MHSHQAVSKETGPQLCETFETYEIKNSIYANLVWWLLMNGSKNCITHTAKELTSENLR